MSELERWWRMVWQMGLVPLKEIPESLQMEFAAQSLGLDGLAGGLSDFLGKYHGDAA